MNYEGKYAELLGLESDTNCHVRSENYHAVIDEYGLNAEGIAKTVRENM